MRVDVAANRRARKWTVVELWRRAMWMVLSVPLFRMTPRVFWGWRRLVLRAFGAQIGRDVHIHASVRVFAPWNLSVGDECGIGDDVRLYCMGPMTLGARTTVSQGSHLCGGTHDLRDPARGLVKAPIRVGCDAWICADAFIGPGVTVGDGAVVAARAVVIRDVEPLTLVAGNPAQVKRVLSPSEFKTND